MIQILVVSSDGTLLNQIPFEGSRQRAKVWADAMRAVAASNGYDTDYSFRFISEG